MPLKQAEIECFLLSLGASQKIIDETEAKGFQAMDTLARSKGASAGLQNEAQVRQAYQAAQEAKKAKAAAALERKLRDLSAEERQRYRLAFDHFDANSSGELDQAEFKMAMIDSGMYPLQFEVKALFEEADADGSGRVDFTEYCRFVQVYKSKQSWLESLMENIMDKLTPKPSYLTNPTMRFVRKMKHADCTRSAIDTFVFNYRRARNPKNVFIAEKDIDPVVSLPDLESVDVERDESLLAKTVMLKLNGGLGTSMGLDKAKSLLEVNNKDTFLDLIVKQVLSLRQQERTPMAFMLMNSFATSKDTMERIRVHHPSFGNPYDAALELMQHRHPKVAEEDWSPAAWPAARELEWCPPGDGDVFPALLGSGMLDKLIAAGYKYMFISSSDNLGATMDLTLLNLFAQSEAPFLMEVAVRTDSDKEGGHLARDGQTGDLMLRESDQCPEADKAQFSDIAKHRYFSTDNLWVDLAKLKDTMVANKGLLPLPVMKILKTIDPRDPESMPVLQLETSMGAAIQAFHGAEAIVVPRSRFAPVKTTSDLLVLKSDAYEKTHDHLVVLRPERQGVPPIVKLDACYNFVDALDELIPFGAPHLLRCRKLTVEGPWTIGPNVVFEGDVMLVNKGTKRKELLAGTYSNSTVNA